MKKIITILGLALSAIVLSNTLFAEKRVISKTIDQYHTAASNNIKKDTARVKWYFIIDTDSLTATLTFPHEFNDINEPFNPDSVYSLTKLGNFPGWEGTWNQAMYNCWSPVIDNYYHNNKYSIATFYTAIQIPDSVEIAPNIKYPVTGIGDNAFNGSNINYIDVPNTVEKIGDYAFANSDIIGQCEASPYQVIPNSVTELGEGIFQDCKNLKRIDIDASVESIPKGTFDGCTNLSQVRFGKMVKTICCDVDTFINNKSLQIAFSSDTVPNITGNIEASEIWYPKGSDTTEYKKHSAKLFDYYIETEKDSFDIEYSKLPLKLNFTQKSYFANPNAVYNYIYYYPAGGGINFSVNALTGRGANKVRFRMLFDGLDHVWQANKVYQIIRQDTATSYAYIDYDAADYTEFVDTVYEVTVRSLDFTRAEAKVKIRVSGTIPIQKVNLYKESKLINNSTDSLAIGEQMVINDTVTDRKNVKTVNQTVEWTTSNETIATVNKDGVVTALKPGKVDVIATSLDPSASNISGKFTIIVFEPKQKTPIVPQAAAINIENQISVTTNGKELTIRSNATLGKIDIYSLDGRLVKSINSSMNVETVNLTNSGIYIIKTTAQTVKVKL
ncbi:MAG: leucine-rich repeat protein [Paramuribaculum sp.]|nr:leucine-rich repeat protein [Paramuribaculum sp.]MDE5836485.1 leucine-rich repeat protein [Paramuribaculum sp.]